MESGRIKKITTEGLKPVIIKVNTIRSDAIELRDAKKPFVVENSPIKAIAKTGKLMSGDGNTLSLVPRQEKTGDKPLTIFPKKSPIWKFLTNNNSMIVSG